MRRTDIRHERRASERSDIYRVIQFKSVKAAGYFFGISRNLSYEGLSFESQAVDIEPGEELELAFKNPHGGMVVSCRGSIIWKKESVRFKTFAGIRFQNLTKVAKDNIMDMLSLSGDMFIDTSSRRGYAGPSVKEANDTEAYKEEPEPARRTEGHLYPGETVNADESGYISKADIYNSDLIPENDDQRKKTGYYITIASLALTAIVITVFAILSNDKKDAGVSSITSPGKASPPAASIKQTSPADGKARIEKLDYSIQVGAWKNPDYAREMLLKLKKYYAGTYMDKKNGFHFIKIKGISTQQQGDAMVQDINKRFGLKPILIKPGQ